MARGRGGGHPANGRCMNPLRRCAPRPPFAPQKGEESPPGIPRSTALRAPSRAPVVDLLGFAKGAGV